MFSTFIRPWLSTPRLILLKLTNYVLFQPIYEHRKLSQLLHTSNHFNIQQLASSTSNKPSSWRWALGIGLSALLKMCIQHRNNQISKQPKSVFDAVSHRIQTTFSPLLRGTSLHIKDLIINIIFSIVGINSSFYFTLVWELNGSHMEFHFKHDSRIIKEEIAV